MTGIVSFESEALALALEILGRQEPGDRRAVSDEFVAMAAAQAGNRPPDLLDFLRAAKERVAALPPLPLPEITVTYGDVPSPTEVLIGQLRDLVARCEVATEANKWPALSDLEALTVVVKWWDERKGWFAAQKVRP